VALQVEQLPEDRYSLLAHGMMQAPDPVHEEVQVVGQAERTGTVLWPLKMRSSAMLPEKKVCFGIVILSAPNRKFPRLKSRKNSPAMLVVATDCPFTNRVKVVLLVLSVPVRATEYPTLLQVFPTGTLPPEAIKKSTWEVEVYNLSICAPAATSVL